MRSYFFMLVSLKLSMHDLRCLLGIDDQVPRLRGSKWGWLPKVRSRRGSIILWLREWLESKKVEDSNIECFSSDFAIAFAREKNGWITSELTNEFEYA